MENCAYRQEQKRGEEEVVHGVYDMEKGCVRQEWVDKDLTNML